MKYVNLVDVCDFQGGSQPPKEQWRKSSENGYIRMLQIRDFTQRNQELEYVKLTNSTKLCSNDDILIARYGASLGKILTGLSGAYNVAIIKSIPCEQKLIKRYLYYYLNTEYFQNKIKNVGSRAAQAGFNKGDLENLQIYLPPIQTQHNIVCLLDKAQELIDKRKTQIEALDELVKSRFIEMFGDPNMNSKGWRHDELSKVLINIENGRSFVCENYSRKGEWPAILKLSAVTYGIYKPFENKALLDDASFIENAEVRDGDLLFTRKNTPELVGMCAYVYETPPNLMMPDLIFRLNTNEKCNKIYLWQLINHSLFRENIKALSNGSAKSMSNISKQRLMNLKIPIPTLELQNQFADFVNQVDKLKFEMENSLKELEDNFNSLMQKAFNGELFN